MKNNDILIRSVSPKDAEALLSIYAPYVKKTAVTFEYDVPSIGEFSQRISNTIEKYPYLVAEIDGEISGYAYVSAFKERAAYDWAVETSIYIDMNKKRLGAGKKLYDTLELICHEQNILNLNACIAYPCSKNDMHLTTESADFHSHIGYSLVGRFHKCGYKFNSWYDMIWMEKLIGDHPAHQQKIKTFDEVRSIIRDKYGII